MKNKVLVVEDDAQISLLYKRLLGEHGFQVFSTPLGSLLDVIGALIKYHDDLTCVIVDGNLGADFNGVDVVRAIRALKSRVRILAVTSEEDLAKEMLELGADEWLLKPFDLTTLFERVSQSTTK